MIDIVERLKHRAWCKHYSDGNHNPDGFLMEDAAAEIAKLRSELEGARNAPKLAGSVASKSTEELYETVRELQQVNFKLAEAEKVIKKISEGDWPRTEGKKWRVDGTYSKHDLCSHGQAMYVHCDSCVIEYVSDWLGKKSKS